MPVLQHEEWASSVSTEIYSSFDPTGRTEIWNVGHWAFHELARLADPLEFDGCKHPISGGKYSAIPHLFVGNFYCAFWWTGPQATLLGVGRRSSKKLRWERIFLPGQKSELPEVLTQGYLQQGDL